MDGKLSITLDAHGMVRDCREAQGGWEGMTFQMTGADATKGREPMMTRFREAILEYFPELRHWDPDLKRVTAAVDEEH
jgi:hypothetical protein